MSKLADTLIELWPQLRDLITVQDETSVTYEYKGGLFSYTVSVDECGRVAMSVDAPELKLSDAEFSALLVGSGSATMMRWMAALIQDRLWQHAS